MRPRGRRGRGRRRRGGRCARGACLRAGLTDAGEHGADRCGLPFLDQHLQHDAVVRAGNLRVDLVGAHLVERVVELHRVARVLEPPPDRALGDGLAQLRHRDVVHHPGRDREAGVLPCHPLGAAHRGARRVAERGPTGRGHAVRRRRQPIRPRRARSRSRSADPHERGADRHGLPRSDEDLHDHAVVGARDLRVDLVGGHLEERVVELHRVACLLEPVPDRALGHRLAQLGHGHDPLVAHHVAFRRCLSRAGNGPRK